MTDQTNDPMELARHVLAVASNFAKAGIDAYRAEHPDEASVLDRVPGLKLGVRVDDITSALPRVVLVIVKPDGSGIDIGTAELRVAGGRGDRGH